jgi:F420-non-reducing hydrogenase iron-sulfur subunit
MKIKQKPKITLFHCLNSFKETASMFAGCEAKIVKMACSSMTKDVFLLKAFEAGADAVVVLVCTEEGCRFSQGSIRAKKRVGFVKNILDEIGLDGRRLSIFNTTAKDENGITQIIQKTLSNLDQLGPNPALTCLN